MNGRIELLTLVPKNGFVCEIGTLKGNFAREMKSNRPDIRLFVVDNWLEPHVKDEIEARQTLKDIALIHKDESVKASELYEDEYFDLIYLDADHTFKGVMADINAWWSKVKRGGYLSGHDYETKAAGDGWHTAIEVKNAVDLWIGSKAGLKIEVIAENAPSWYVRKP